MPWDRELLPLVLMIFFCVVSEWSPVLSGEIKQEVDDFLSQDAELHEYAGKINHYSKYIEQASHVPTSGTLHVFR